MAGTENFVFLFNNIMMNKNFKKFSDICNAHKGIIELMVLIVAVIAVLIDNLHKLSSLNLFPKIINIR